MSGYFINEMKKACIAINSYYRDHGKPMQEYEITQEQFDELRKLSMNGEILTKESAGTHDSIFGVRIKVKS